MNDSNNNHHKQDNQSSSFSELKNICSWLLIVSPVELAFLSSILATIVSRYLTTDEQSVLGSFAGAFASDLQLIAAQNGLIEAAQEELEKMIDQDEKDNEIKDLKKKLAESNKRIDQLEQLNKKIEKLEKLLQEQKKL